MHRVIISTWVGNTSLNYGSLLQATALQWSLKSLCSDVIPITLNVNRWSNTSLLCREINNIKKFGLKYEISRAKFLSWCHKNLNMSPMCRDEKDIVAYAKKNADILMTGSDTVWFGEHIRPAFMWDYPELSNKPAIAYSVSLKNDKTLEYENNSALNRFVGISVREFSSKSIIDKEWGKEETDVTIDPTLLISGDIWSRYATKRLIIEPYIICYFLEAPEKYYIALLELKKLYPDCRIVFIDTNYIDKFEYAFFNYRGMEYKRTVGPREYLSLIKHAEFVCADGYHGTCFSIVFKRPFVVFNSVNNKKGYSDMRVPDLLNRLGLEKQMFFTEKKSEEYIMVDWEKVYKKLDGEIKHSLNYLKEKLKLSFLRIKENRSL